MSQNLLILAGKSAYNHIRERGLSPSDITVVMGASGAAKWLVLYGLDSAIFSHWFKGRKQPLYLFGTSIGAWKFAAAAQGDPVGALDRLREAYTHQTYKGRVTPAKVSEESLRIIDLLLPPGSIEQILSHPYLRISFSAVRCKGLMGKKHHMTLSVGMLSAFALNVLSRKLQKLYFERTVFHDSRNTSTVLDMTDFTLNRVQLTLENFHEALLATGSIPLIMEGIENIEGAPKGMYRDGGILDYHPAFPLRPKTKGLILYPHFYPHLTLGWFDKRFPKRRAKADVLDQTVILAPSPEFVSRLPFGRIPDRKDFVRLAGKDEERIQAWEKAASMSLGLGEAFLEAVETGRIRDEVKLMES
ncbi:MAG: patatin-like phospholipase family protein [Deltaproteobacteria bacterium]|nr:patatin-like phospholipase family protein [Deltaproteobacteria bacterium]